jgi:8-oxo-dGTP diphosphatase
MRRRTIRYQAAIVREHHVLLLRVHDHAGSGEVFWVLPGGGREPGESAEECVRREIHEETRLDVRVERLLFAAPDMPGGLYDQLHTYLCAVVSGDATPGIEPEVDTPEQLTIQELAWFDLRAPEGWDALVRGDSITYPLLQQVRERLGYPPTP